MMGIMNSLLAAVSQTGKAIVKGDGASNGLSTGAVIMLIVGVAVLYGGLAICLTIAIKKGKAPQEDESAQQ